MEKDAPRAGRKPKVSAKKIRTVVETTLHSPPPNATHLEHSEHGENTTPQSIHYPTDMEGTQSETHRVKTFKLSRDKRFVEKLQDVVGLYLNPLDKALVMCVDERSQVQVHPQQGVIRFERVRFLSKPTKKTKLSLN